jgi:hypothetical protein
MWSAFWQWQGDASAQRATEESSRDDRLHGHDGQGQDCIVSFVAGIMRCIKDDIA